MSLLSYNTRVSLTGAISPVFMGLPLLRTLSYMRMAFSWIVVGPTYMIINS